MGYCGNATMGIAKMSKWGGAILGDKRVCLLLDALINHYLTDTEISHCLSDAELIHRFSDTVRNN